ncbi:MAG TPA: TIGR04282 family arsenosugar biosynthesis glycosyltransferase [Nitrospirota bacterium]|nr:TIGR04282 family arsenosugar biosynthesis glycosyltransferase [Nitrospirota bacterium]
MTAHQKERSRGFNNIMPSTSIIILFAKIPVKGRVKTRLARDLEEDLALRFSESMLLDTIDMLKDCGFPFRICIAPPGAVETARARLGGGYAFMPQTGDDLGERMEQAFVRVFTEGFREAVLIGSDIPGLSAGIVREAFASLSEHGAVIGPANDGGYYLIGFTRGAFWPEIFHSMPWSTPAVFGETLGRLASASRRVHVLPECIDVDTSEDLITLLQQKDRPASPRTLALLKRQGRGLAK